MQNNVNFCELTPYAGLIRCSQLGVAYLPTYLSKRTTIQHSPEMRVHHFLTHARVVFVKICPFLFGWSRLKPMSVPSSKKWTDSRESDRAVIARPTKDQGRHGGGVASWRYLASNRSLLWRRRRPDRSVNANKHVAVVAASFCR